MSRKIKIELTQQQFMLVQSAIFYDINDMKLEKETEGLPQPELRVLVNAYNAMIEGLEQWKLGRK